MWCLLQLFILAFSLVEYTRTHYFLIIPTPHGDSFSQFSTKDIKNNEFGGKYYLPLRPKVGPSSVPSDKINGISPEKAFLYLDGKLIEKKDSTGGNFDILNNDGKEKKKKQIEIKIVKTRETKLPVLRDMTDPPINGQSATELAKNKQRPSKYFVGETEIKEGQLVTLVGCFYTDEFAAIRGTSFLQFIPMQPESTQINVTLLRRMFDLDVSILSSQIIIYAHGKWGIRRFVSGPLLNDKSEFKTEESVYSPKTGKFEQKDHTMKENYFVRAFNQNDEEEIVVAISEYLSSIHFINFNKKKNKYFELVTPNEDFVYKVKNFILGISNPDNYIDTLYIWTEGSPNNVLLLTVLIFRKSNIDLTAIKSEDFEAKIYTADIKDSLNSAVINERIIPKNRNGALVVHNKYTKSHYVFYTKNYDGHYKPEDLKALKVQSKSKSTETLRKEVATIIHYFSSNEMYEIKKSAVLLDSQSVGTRKDVVRFDFVTWFFRTEEFICIDVDAAAKFEPPDAKHPDRYIVDVKEPGYVLVKAHIKENPLPLVQVLYVPINNNLDEVTQMNFLLPNSCHDVDLTVDHEGGNSFIYAALNSVIVEYKFTHWVKFGDHKISKDEYGKKQSAGACGFLFHLKSFKTETDTKSLYVYEKAQISQEKESLKAKVKAFNRLVTVVMEDLEYIQVICFKNRRTTKLKLFEKKDCRGNTVKDVHLLGNQDSMHTILIWYEVRKGNYLYVVNTPTIQEVLKKNDRKEFYVEKIHRGNYYLDFFIGTSFKYLVNAPEDIVHANPSDDPMFAVTDVRPQVDIDKTNLSNITTSKNNLFFSEREAPKHGVPIHAMNHFRLQREVHMWNNNNGPPNSNP